MVSDLLTPPYVFSNSKHIFLVLETMNVTYFCIKSEQSGGGRPPGVTGNTGG